MKIYLVKYKMAEDGEELDMPEICNTQQAAYMMAVDIHIPEKHGSKPFAAYVYGVAKNETSTIYKNNSYKNPYYKYKEPKNKSGKFF